MVCATLWTNALQDLLALAVGEVKSRVVAAQRLDLYPKSGSGRPI